MSQMFKTIRRAVRKIKKIFVYIPFLWKEDDYGYEDMINLLKFKVTRMEEHIRKSKHDYIGKDENCEAMREFISELNKYQNPKTFENMTAQDIRKISAVELRKLNIQESQEMEEAWGKAMSILLLTGQNWSD